MATHDKVPATDNRGRSVADPFEALHQRIDRLFGDFSRGFGVPGRLWDEGMRLPSVWGEGREMPAIEMHDSNGRIVISAELPGVEEKDIDVSVADDLLTISGEKKSEVEHKDGEKFRSERTYGRFSRSFTLPFAIDAEKVEAKFDKGVLKLTIPRPPEAPAKVKKVAIRH